MERDPLKPSGKKIKNKKTRIDVSKYLRLLVVCTCVLGYTYQTLEFLQLYWTYPTVVDIQQESPSYLDVPAFTICNPIGYNYDEICQGLKIAPCIPSKMNRYASYYFCNYYPAVCYGGKVPKDFKVITYSMFMNGKIQFTSEINDKLRQHLEEYMTCTIEFAGTVEACDMDNVMGSYFSKDELPQFCYTIYSLWGQPDKKRPRIPKGAIMKFNFHLNATRRPQNNDPKAMPQPKHNMPVNPSVQIAVHSPYFLPTPYLEGSNYLGGKAYELRVTMDENHLLPAPYQTNCTDYMKQWKKRGGKAPINQLGMVQECRMQKYYDAYGCVPMEVDYPHSYTVCGGCGEDCKYNVSEQECIHLADHYNQPCDFIDYITRKEEIILTKTIDLDLLEELVEFRDRLEELLQNETSGELRKSIPEDDERPTREEIDQTIAVLNMNEKIRIRTKGYDCSGNKVWSDECSNIDIDVLFDRFEITKLTYNPKFENLELFSVIGGYMGMWLGISLVTIYDFIGTVIRLLNSWRLNRKRNKVQPKKKKMQNYAKEKLLDKRHPPRFYGDYYW